MKKALRKIAAAAVVAVMAFGVTGCGNGEEEKEVNIGYFNNVTHAQALLMKSAQTLEKSLGDEMEVVWTAFNAGPAEVEALFAGDIDIGYIGPVPAITANVKSGGDVEILSGASKGGSVLIKSKDSGIESVADLAGKNVSIPQIGNTQHLCLLGLLAENGLSPVTEGGDVTLSAVTNADVANTMEHGDIDASIVPEPWGATLLEQGAELLLDYDALYLDGDYDVAVVVVRKEFKEEHPEIVEQFLAAHENATDAINNDHENALNQINEELKSATGKNLSDSIITEAFSRMEISTEYSKSALESFANLSKEQGFIAEVPGEELYAK